ncbi:MAG: response regulator [Brevundimonas sp.]|uniref:response regulator n=1 Tax=Brevundimonas sp. TaxID=1871086 RepID=UPI0024873049|nr:response regulator [Brevundimonas sp.]MDI1327183.1 response regulator [Brevundimonas sp.]
MDQLTDPLYGKIILIIEDDPTLLRTLCHGFRVSGCQVLPAQDGEEGLAKFDRLRPDIVVTDILMPNREGVETILTMKKRAPDVKILAISGGGVLGATTVLDLAHRLGADAVLTKPFRSGEVLDVVRRLIAPAASADD